jgi:hypothetical protein
MQKLNEETINPDKTILIQNRSIPPPETPELVEDQIVAEDHSYETLFAAIPRDDDDQQQKRRKLLLEIPVHRQAYKVISLRVYEFMKLQVHEFTTL